MFIDTHAHIYLNKSSTLDEIVKNKKIDQFISIGIDIPSSQTCIDLAHKYPNLTFAVIGVHPNSVGDTDMSIDDVMMEFEEMIIANRNVVVGIGETGLDYFRLPDTGKREAIALQKEYFKAHILLAKKYNLPFIVHSRDARDDTFKIIKEMGYKKYILHCFSEDLETAQRHIERSDECVISFSGIVTFPSAKNLHHVAAHLPLNRIIVETDAPFLAPVPLRGTENIPDNILHILQYIFTLRKEAGHTETLEEMQEQIYLNSKRIYGI